MLLLGFQSFASARRFRRVMSTVICISSVLLLAGCLVGREKPDAALDIPSAYRTPVRNPDAALPTPDWWRGFRSRQLTGLIEEALTSNLDIAAAVARIVQADAQARIAGAALLPAVQLDADYSRSRSSRTSGPSSGASGGGSTRTLYST